MKIFAIADLHLGFQVDKPMSEFGAAWDNHTQRIQTYLEEVASKDDLILIPGDISWALKLSEVHDDLRYINQLPGQKLLLRGNHDFWWSSLSKIKKLAQELELSTLDFLQNDARRYPNGIVICGTRGWKHADEKQYKKEIDLPIWQREVQRLELSLKAGKKLLQANDRLIVMMHYPPFAKNLLATEFTKLMSEYQVERCVFGHIHHNSPQVVHKLYLDGVVYSICACDQINCQAIQLV